MTPLSPDVISRQATINIGMLFFWFGSHIIECRLEDRYTILFEILNTFNNKIKD